MVRRNLPVVALGRPRRHRVLRLVACRRRSSDDAERIRSCPFLTGCWVGRPDDDVAASPERDETERPFRSLNRGTIIRVFDGVNKPGDLQQLVMFCIRFSEAGVCGSFCCDHMLLADLARRRIGIGIAGDGMLTVAFNNQDGSVSHRDQREFCPSRELAA